MIDLGVGGDVVELEALGEHVAKVERQVPRQRLQAHQGHELAQAGIDLEELAVLGLHLHVAGKARVVDCQRIAVPRERALQPYLAALDEVGIAHALEELAAIGDVELEVGDGGQRRELATHAASAVDAAARGVLVGLEARARERPHFAAVARDHV